MHGFTMQAINCGRSPATIIDAVVEYVKLKSLKELSEIPDYEKMKRIITERVLVSYTADAPQKLSILTLMQSARIIPQAEYEKMQSGELFYYGYGIVRYYDIFKIERKSAFGYLCYFPTNPDAWPKHRHFRKTGPQAYNETT